MPLMLLSVALLRTETGLAQVLLLIYAYQLGQRVLLNILMLIDKNYQRIISAF